MNQVSDRSQASSTQLVAALDGARPGPATARGRRTRQALLDAAEAVFGERGYYSAHIVEITQRSHVALGTFYLYFPDKKTVFDELVHTLNHRLRVEIQQAVAALGDRIDTEVVGFETFFRFVRRHRNLYRVIRQAEFVNEALYRWHYRTLAEGYVAGLRQAQSAGQVRTELDPETLAYALMGMAEGLGMRWALWEDRGPARRVRRTVRSLLEAGLRPGVEPAPRPGGAAPRRRGGQAAVAPRDVQAGMPRPAGQDVPRADGQGRSRPEETA